MVEDYTVLRMILARMFTWDNFHFVGSTYSLRIDKRFLDHFMGLIRKQFNSGIVYDGKRLYWDTVILRKCEELSRYLLGRRRSFDLSAPRPVLQRSDSRLLREKILSLSQPEAYKLGIARSTFHYLQKKAGQDGSFRVYGKVRKRLMPQSASGKEVRRG